MPPPNKRAVARILSVEVGAAAEQRTAREAAREEAARRGLSLGEYLTRQLDQNEGPVTEPQAQPRSVRHAYDDEDDDWAVSAPTLERSPTVANPADRSSLDEAAVDIENAAPENEVVRAARMAFQQAFSAVRDLAVELQKKGVALSLEGDLFASRNSLSKSTQLIIRIDGRRFKITLDHVAKVTAQNAPNDDELFERIAELHDSGVLALVSAEAKGRLKEQVEIEVARAKDANWYPTRLFDPRKDDPWEFYLSVYKGKDKPSAGRLYECDRPLYKRLTARASRNKTAGLPKGEDNPHSIHDIFPERVTISGRTVRAPKLTP
jgi:hypothetical protein